jgi:hypothetical protein
MAPPIVEIGLVVSPTRCLSCYLEVVVIFVASYPIPSDNAIFIPTHGAVTSADTNRIDRVSWVDLFEMEGWMIRIGMEKLICFDSVFLYL